MNTYLVHCTNGSQFYWEARSEREAMVMVEAETGNHAWSADNLTRMGAELSDEAVRELQLVRNWINDEKGGDDGSVQASDGKHIGVS